MNRAANPFESLLSFCRSCGREASTGSCPRCGVSLEGPVRLPSLGVLGARATVRFGLTRKTGVIAGGSSDQYLMVWEDGTTELVPTSRVRGVEQNLTSGWSRSGAILAASRQAGVTAPQAQTLREAAVRGSAQVSSRRGLLRDALWLDMPEVVSPAGLGLTATEYTWVAAVVAHRRGQFDVCTHRLSELPNDAYAARLALWFTMGSRGIVSSDDAVAILEALPDLAATSPSARVAAAMISAVLDEDANPADVWHAAWQAQSAGPDAIVWHSMVGAQPWTSLSTPAATALRALHGDGLIEEPAALEPAPWSVVDDIIDRGAISREQLADLDGFEVGPYVLARTAPDLLSAEQLEGLNYEPEVLRRAFLAGNGCPDDVSADGRQQFEGWVRARDAATAPEEVIQGLVGQLGDSSPLAAYLRGEIACPDETELEPAVSVALASSQPADPRNSFPPLSPRQREFLGLSAAVRARDALLAWDWQDALETARAGLRYTREERLRDELLNLLACALWQLDKDEDALSALESALEGDYTEALQSNIAVVASDLEPELAAEHLARLVIEAPNLASRLSAARRAVEIWGTTDEPWSQGDQLPPPLSAALRSLLVEDIPLDDFRMVLQLLSDYDADWLAEPERLKGSPHENSDEAHIYVGRARGFDEYLRALGDVLRRSDAPQWTRDVRDGAVAAALRAIIVDDPPLGAIAFGSALLDQQLPMDKDDLAVLRAFVARAVAMNIDPEDGEPSEKFLTWLEAAASDLRGMDDSMRDRAASAVQMGFRSLTFAYLGARWNQFQDAAQLHDAVLEGIHGVPRYQLNTSAVLQTLSPIRTFCSDTRRLALRLRRHTEPDVQEHIDDLLKAIDDLDRSTTNLV